VIAWPYPAPKDDGGTRHLTRGKPLPSIQLASSKGGTVDLSRQPSVAVVFAYTWTGRPGLANPPGWDDIPGAHGSTPQAEGFRNLYTAYTASDVEVFGLSVQSTDWQRELASRIELPFALLSDGDLLLQKALGLPTFETGGVTYLKRLTIVIEDGRILRTFYPVHPPDTHAREVLAWLAATLGYTLESRRRPG
jgi:peroxiredoxin